METGIRLGLTLVQIGAVMVAVLLTVAALTLLERKVLGWMQDRMGPMEVGPLWHLATSGRWSQALF